MLPISQNTALFSLLGTYYGGDGKSTFALPDIQGSVVMGVGQGPGLSGRVLGETDGSPAVTLPQTDIPAHNHALRAHGGDPANLNAPSAQRSMARSNGGFAWGPPTNLTPMALEASPPVGGGQPHNNMQPFLALNYFIALQGIYPPRS